MMEQSFPVSIGCAGWSIPGIFGEWFPGEGSHLERYAGRFPVVEINTSFYRLHQRDTYLRWSQSVPPGFHFAVKLLSEITHQGRLADLSLLDAFLEGISGLGDRLGPLLVQLPPDLGLHPQTADNFFTTLRSLFAGQVVCEPRHPAWFTDEASLLLASHQVARAAADPARLAAAARPGGWEGLVYYRLHGSPKMYVSAYGEPFLEQIGQHLVDHARSAPVWCIFDNTAGGAAIPNAFMLMKRVGF